MNSLAWVVTAYLLTSTVSTPLYGKLGDQFGRKTIFQIAIVVFLVGSALSGIAQNIGELIAFRALQGIGGGGLMVALRPSSLTSSHPASEANTRVTSVPCSA